MDPDIIELLNEQFREMTEILSEQNSMMAAQMRAMKGQTDSSGKVTKANKEQGEATESNTKKQLAYIKAERERQAAVKEATDRINKSLDFTAGAFMSLGSAVMDSTHSFQKYNGTLGMAGDAAAGLGKNFGVLGHVLGGVIKASTKLLQYQLEQADSLLKFNDQVSKMGAMNAFGSEQILEMGNKAGFAAKDLEKLSAPMQKLGSTFKQIGDGAADSTKKFMEMAAVGSDTRQEFQRLGYSQTELVEAQSDYIRSMGEIGFSTRIFGDNVKTLQKASLDYIKNLHVLSELTGLSAEDAMKERERAAADMQGQMYVLEMMQKIKNASSEEEKLKLAQDLKNTLDMRSIISRQYGEDVGRGYMQQVQGAPQTVGLGEAAIQNVLGDIGNYAQLARSGNLDPLRMAQISEDLQAQKLSVLQGPLGRISLFSEDMAKMLGGPQAVKETTRKMDYDATGATKEIIDGILSNEDGVGPSADDGFQKARNELTESEIALRTGFDKFAFTLGLVIPAMFALATTAGLAALALGKGGTLGRLGSILSGVRPAAAATGAAATGAAATGASKLGKVGAVAKGAVRVLGKLALPLAAGMALYDSFQGFNADPNASFGGKLANAGKSALSGATFGLLGSSPEEIAKGSEPASDPTTDATAETKNQADTKTTEAFNKSVAAFGRIVIAFSKTTKTFASSTNDLVKTMQSLSSLMKPLLEMGSTSRNFGRSKSGLLGTPIGGDDEFDIIEYIEKLKTSLNDTATASNNLRDAEMKRHRFTEESMLQFRRSLGDLTKTIGGITGIDRTDPSNDSAPGPDGRPGGSPGAPSDTRASKPFKGGKKEFYDTMYNTLLESARRQQVENPEAIARLGTAQSALETGYGKKAPNNNYFGIKGGDGPALATEEVIGGRRVKTRARFRSYGSMQESADDYIRFLKENPRYKDVLAAKSAEEAISAQASSGYATDPKYGAKLSDIHRRGTAPSDGAVTTPSEPIDNKDTGKIRTTEQELSKMGLVLKSGDVHGPNYPLDKRAIALAKKIQETVPDFRYFSAMNDRFHHKLNYVSQHTKGKAIDFTLNRKPTKKQGQELESHLRSLGANYARDEYNRPTAAATAGHMHVQFAEKGGVFDGPNSGYPAVLHGSEMVAPLNQDSILMKLAKTPAEADEISQVTSPSPSAMQKEILDRVVNMNSEMMDNMLRKLDDMVSAINDGNDTREKILKNNMN